MDTNFAVIVNGAVSNVIVIDAADQATIDHFGAVPVPEGSPVAIGWEFAGGQFIAPPAPLPLPVTALTPRQIRLVLNAVGLRAQVEAAVAAADQNTKDMWAFSQVFKRSDPVLLAMAAQVGVSDAQLDQLFAQGATL